jgi:hypothetical protein
MALWFWPNYQEHPRFPVMQAYKLEMYVHSSSIPTLRAVASGSSESTPMLAVCCQEAMDRSIRLSLYNDTYEGEKNHKPLKVDTFVTVKKGQKDQVSEPACQLPSFQIVLMPVCC